MNKGSSDEDEGLTELLHLLGTFPAGWAGSWADQFHPFKISNPYGNATPLAHHWACVREGELGPVEELAEAMV